MDRKVEEWLLQGPPWLVYAVETQLLGRRVSPEKALADPAIREVMSRLRGRNPADGSPSSLSELKSEKGSFLHRKAVSHLSQAIGLFL